MSTNKYIKELERCLSVLDKSKKEEIVKEIQSYIQESDVDYSLLVERFGTPEDLAKSYLEDMDIEEKAGKSIYSKAKKVALTIFIFLVIVFIVIGTFIYFKTKDPFDYSKYNAQSIEDKLNRSWNSFDGIKTIDISQSKIVIYWNNEGQTKVSCKENKTRLERNILFIKQANCYLTLPSQNSEIKTYQSKVILVEPSQSVNLNSEQSRIMIAQNGKDYSFKFDGTQSNLNNFKSKKEGILIKGTFYQSKVTPYEY